jgi:hypothetical protein
MPEPTEPTTGPIETPKRGRKSGKFDKKVAYDVLRAWSMSRYSLEHVLDELRAANPRYPSLSVVWTWRIENDEFEKAYARAKRFKAEYLADKTLDEALIPRKGVYKKASTKNGRTEQEVREDDNVPRSRLINDTYKWRAAKLFPKEFEERREPRDEQGPNEQLEALQKALLEGAAEDEPVEETKAGSGETKADSPETKPPDGETKS